MRKDIIVTGGTGFIGSTLAKELIKHINKDRILFLAWDKNSGKEKRGRKNLENLKLDYQLVDLNKINTLHSLPKSPRIIIHLAASTDTLDNDHRVNFSGTKNLVKAIKPNKNTFFIHISTVADMSGRKDLNRPITEKDSAIPTNSYGRSKHLGEKYLISFSKKVGMPLTVLRLNTVYGPGENGNNIFRSINKMSNENSPIIRLNWPGKITVIHKDDIVKSIIKIAINKRKYKNKTYILGTEDFSFSNLIYYAYQYKNKNYSEIKIPNSIWNIVSSATLHSFHLENVLDYKSYNWLWRLNLITNDIFWCNTSRWKDELVDWKTKTYQQSLGEVYD